MTFNAIKGRAGGRGERGGLVCSFVYTPENCCGWSTRYRGGPQHSHRVIEIHWGASNLAFSWIPFTPGHVPPDRGSSLAKPVFWSTRIVHQNHPNVIFLFS